MTEKLRKAWLAQQKASDKLRSLASDATAETRAAAETEFNQVASALQVVLDQEPDEALASPDAESAELRRLLDGSNLGRFYEAAVEHRALDGREAELQQHFRLGGNAFPVELLRDPVEHRAVTPAPSDTGATQRPVLQPVFARGDAAFLGVSMPTVPVGDSVHPVLTSRPTVGVKATSNSDAVAETTGSFSVEVLKPSRLAGCFLLAADGSRPF